MTFKDYILLEVKASAANIDRFIDTYRVQMSEEEVTDFFASFDAEVKRGTLKRIDNPKAHATDPHDIFSYHSWDDLHSTVSRAKETKTKQEVRKIEKEGATKVFQNDKVVIVHPKTHEASCHYGASSKWCTAMRDRSEHFNSYANDQGVVLLYFLPKEDSRPQLGTSRKQKTTMQQSIISYYITPKHLNGAMIALVKVLVSTYQQLI